MRIFSLLLFLSLTAQAQEPLENLILKKMEKSEAFEYFKQLGVKVSVKLAPNPGQLAGSQKFFRSSGVNLSRVEIKLDLNFINEILKELDILSMPKTSERIAAILIPRALAELEAAKISENNTVIDEKIKAVETAELRRVFQERQDSWLMTPQEAKYLEERFGSTHAIMRNWRLTFEQEKKWQRLAAPAVEIKDSANFIVETRDSLPRVQWDMTMRVWKQQSENLDEKALGWGLEASAVKKLAAHRVISRLFEEISEKIPSHPDYHKSQEFDDRYKPMLLIAENTKSNVDALTHEIGARGIRHWLRLLENPKDPNLIVQYLSTAVEWSKHIENSKQREFQEEIHSAIKNTLATMGKMDHPAAPSISSNFLGYALTWTQKFMPGDTLADDFIEAYLCMAARASKINPNDFLIDYAKENAHRLAGEHNKDISGRIPDLERLRVEGWINQAKRTLLVSDAQYILNNAEKKANANRLDQEFAPKFALAQADVAARYGDEGDMKSFSFCIEQAQRWAKQAGNNLSFEKENKRLARGLAKQALRRTNQVFQGDRYLKNTALKEMDEAQAYGEKMGLLEESADTLIQSRILMAEALSQWRDPDLKEALAQIGKAEALSAKSKIEIPKYLQEKIRTLQQALQK